MKAYRHDVMLDCCQSGKPSCLQEYMQAGLLWRWMANIQSCLQAGKPTRRQASLQVCRRAGQSVGWLTGRLERFHFA